MAENGIDIDVAVQGINELKKLADELKRTSEQAKETEKSGSSALSKLGKSLKGIGGTTLKGITTLGKGLGIVGAAATAAAGKILSTGSEMDSMRKSAIAFAKSPEEGKAAWKELTNLSAKSGLEIEATSKKMNAFLASGQDPKSAANLALMTEYLERMGEEGASAAGHLQDMAAGVPLTATHFEDLAKGAKISNQQIVEALGYTGKLTGKAGELDAIAKQFNAQFGNSKEALERLKQAGVFDQLTEEAKTAGSATEKMANSLKIAMGKVTEGIDFNKLLDPILSFLTNDEMISFFKEIVDGAIQGFNMLGGIIKNLPLRELIDWAKSFIKSLPFDQLKPIFKELGNLITALIPVLQFLGDVVSWLLRYVFLPVLKALIIAVTGTVEVLKAIFVGIYTFFVNVFSQWPDFWNGVWDIIVNGLKIAWNAIVGVFDGAVDLGRNIILGLIKGIMNAKNWLINTIKNVATGAIDTFKSVFGIASPSKEMKKIGRYNMQGLAIGQEKESSRLNASNEKLAQSTLGSFGSSTTNSNSSVSINNTIYISGNNKEEIKAGLFEFFDELKLSYG